MPSIYVIHNAAGGGLAGPSPTPFDAWTLAGDGFPVGSVYSMYIDGDPAKARILQVCTDAGWMPYAPPLGPQQQVAYDFAMEGHSCFITGPGGVGKSELTRRLVNDLRRKGKIVAVTASTGVAAVNIRGMTIHSTLGTGIAGNRVEAQRKYTVEAAAKAEKRLCDVDTIILDEVSMLTGDYIDMMDWWLRLILGIDRPFADKQIIFVGDFLQLPPVIKDSERDRVFKKYAFQSDIWEANPPSCFYLRQCYRQDDADFRKHLMRVRRGICPNDTLDYFNARCHARLPAGTVPTKLRATNKEADLINDREFRKLKSPTQTYDAQFQGHPSWIEALKKNLPCEEILDLKVGAEVVFIKNNRLVGYVNGTRGVVESLEGHVQVRTRDGTLLDAQLEEWEMVNSSDQVLAKVIQYPLRLAWAMTIHKAQGSTLDDLDVDPTSIFERGQCYVALSRVRSINGLTLTAPLLAAHVRASRLLVDWYGQILEEEKAAQASGMGG